MGVRAGSITSVDVPSPTGEFHTTHWSVVTAARAGEGTAAAQALGKLCAIYWYPLYVFIRRKGAEPHAAEDLTQEFFLDFLQRHALHHVQPGNGRFRSFLLACLNNFLANQRERARAQRRGGGQVHLPLQTGDAETRYSLEPVDNVTPEVAFERRWAYTILEHTITELRREYSKAEKGWRFEDLEGFLPNGRGGFSRAELAAKRGVSVGAVDVAVHRLRQRFAEVLRQQVASTVSSEAEVREEIRHLISILSA
jgi:RNA polymerase sigma factor (sigma-70 family)